MFELLPVHGSFSRPTITLNILAYSNTSLLTHLTTFNTLPFMATYILFFYSFLFPFFFLILFLLYIPLFFNHADGMIFFIILFKYFINFFYFYCLSHFLMDADLRKGTLCPFCVPIHKKKKKKKKKIKSVKFSEQVLSKRSLLSQVSSVFDPLGLISPLVIRGKMLIQRAWAEKLGWDALCQKTMWKNGKN